MAKSSDQFVTGVTFNNGSCIAAYGNTLSPYDIYDSCIFPGNCIGYKILCKAKL